MTLEEARAVFWLSNNHRPLGELLDEGFLTRSRLKWAVQKAYDPQLKQAAAILLASMKAIVSDAPVSTVRAEPSQVNTKLPPLEIAMTIEQARAIKWPMRNQKGQPMGSLVDSKQLSLKDLAYAIENAWDRKVKLAAALLMALRLQQAVNELPPPSGWLKVVSGGRSYAERRQLLLSLIEGAIAGAGMASAAGLLVWSTYHLLTSRPPQAISRIIVSPIGIVALVVMIGFGVAISWLFNKFFDWFTTKLGDEIENYRKGQEGEDRVVEIMQQTLDGSWHLFRNANLPGRNRADLDGILLGPSGIYVLEIKSYSGEYRNWGDQWKYRAGKKWKPLGASPSRQAQGNALRLSNFLKADRIKQWVIPVIVWANPDGTLSVENPAVAVWQLDDLRDELGNVVQGETIGEADCSKIAAKLTALIKTTTSKISNSGDPD